MKFNACSTDSAVLGVSVFHQVSLDLASFETVRDCREGLTSVLREGLVDLLFCNEQEAQAYAQVSQFSSP